MGLQRWSVLVGSTALMAGLLSPAGLGPAVAAPPAMPHVDHVVVLVEENRDSAESLGSPDAPWINALARDGAVLTQMHAEAHPSQPNYVALFSGSTQGVSDDNCPYSLDAPNLATSLADAGRSFVGYSEDMPSAGFTGCFWNGYARKHNPWVDFANVPASSNQPFTAFPTDFSTLPAVSFVVPNLAHDMHDGTVAEGDAWLAANMDAYVTWAKAHNSLFILTWDESDLDPDNQIATVIAGAGVVAGSYPETATHYSLLRTIEDAFGLAPVGASAAASPLVDVFSGAPETPTSARDSFTRTVTGGWGAADVGGPWAVSPSSAMAVNGSQGTMAMTAGLGASAYVGSVSTADTDIVTSMSTDKPTTGSGLYVSLVGRRISGSGDYRVKTRITSTGAVALTLERTSATGAETAFTPETAVAGLSASPGSQIRVRLQVTGTSPTALRARAWAASAVEPTAWNLVTTDTTAALQAGGSVGLSAYLSSAATNAPITVAFDDLAAQGTTASPQDKAPVAAFTTGGSGLTATANGSTSSDPEGGALTYAWTFGDGATATGVTTSHAYAAAGNYPITLTVTDPGGLTNAVTHTVAVAPPNQPPTAAFTSSSAGLTASLDATTSSDPEAGTLSYAWGFGDATSGTGATTSHTYAAAGTYTVTVTVTDPGGLTSTVSHPVTVAAANQAPAAAFTGSSSGLTTTLDASTSSDPEGGILGYGWDFGDGGTGTGVGLTHTYAAAGTYAVELTVTDPGGLTDTVSHTVTVSGQVDQPPAAAFTTGGSGLSVSVDASMSSDPEGGALGYDWTFGDGSTGTGLTSSHAYASAGTYTITLTVTDPAGLTSTISHALAVAPVDQPPTVAFTSSTSALTVTLDGTTSADPEGGTLTYAWAFGDATTGTGATTSHTYATAGTYTVTLTVTDPGGLASAVSHTVTATAPSTAFASDAFSRTLSSTWGTADLGGLWTVTNPASNYAVASGVGTLRATPGGSTNAYLLGTSSSRTDLAVSLRVDRMPGGTGLYAGVVGRRTASAGDYRVAVHVQGSGAVSLFVERVAANGAETVFGRETTVPGVTLKAGTQLRVRLQVTGTTPTTLRARAWLAGTAEPTTWTVSATDSTAALQTTGAVGVTTYLSSRSASTVTVSVDDLVANRL